jgi:hypothetical protein
MKLKIFHLIFSLADKPRPEGEWEGSQILRDILEAYAGGNIGWLKGGQDHVENEWISWHLIWAGKPVVGNCLKCPETYQLLQQTLTANKRYSDCWIFFDERWCKIKRTYRCKQRWL